MNLRNIYVVWYRNFCLFKKVIFNTMFWITLEPILYLLAFGIGIGTLVDEVKGLTYLEYYYPGRLINTAMMITFFEGTYPVMAKFQNHHTYLSMSFSPMKSHEICIGELLWIACKGLMAVLLTIIVSSFVGLGAFKVLHSLPILIMHCWIFACVSIIISSVTESTKAFAQSAAAIMLPLSLFTGTFFPLENLPRPLELFFGALPPAQALIVIRAITHDEFQPHHLVNTGVLLFYLIVITWISLMSFKNRLEQ